MANYLLSAAIDFARCGLRIGLLFTALIMSPSVVHAAASISAPVSGHASGVSVDPVLPRLRIDMKGLTASVEVRLVADWIMRYNKHNGHPFIIAAKADSLLFAFNANGELLAKTPALFGAARSDVLTEEQAGKTIEDTLESDKITPAGLFAAEAYLSPSYGKSVRYAKYAQTNLLIHRAPNAMRLKRLQSPTTSDNRITYGCINVLPEFVDNVLVPVFSGESTVVVLPETQLAASFFEINDATEPVPQTENKAGYESFINSFLRHTGEYRPRVESSRRNPARTPRKSEDETTPDLAAIGKIKADFKKNFA